MVTFSTFWTNKPIEPFLPAIINKKEKKKMNKDENVNIKGYLECRLFAEL